ncbi:MAG: chloramphenicol acetyltransferase [Clostridia bacterium]|nr:chloramphenicol acetyltransferase [Clostridia bacterium]
MIDRETYDRKGLFRRFSEDCKCSTSMTARIDATELAAYSGKTGTKFYINFLYILSKVLNSRDDYKMGYLWQTDELICYDRINPTQYVFHEDTETCTPVYTEYDEDYGKFYDALHIELPDGHLFFAPIVNWGKYRNENGRLVMPVSVRLNHAIAGGYLAANVFRLLEKEIKAFAGTGL